MMSVNDEYSQERNCEYKGESYSVRDNGAVLRHARKGKKIRKDDEIWTFGKPNEVNGYMFIGTARIHQIVAFAFLGKPENPNLVVDHKDSNKRNNRPENLHWVTRLENALNNPATRWKIELHCGSIENFLSNPELLRGHEHEHPNFSWMRTVTKEEGLRTLQRMNQWAKEKKVPTGNGAMGEWIFSETVSSPQEKTLILENDYTESLTQNAIQYKWKTPTEFLLCPQTISNHPLEDYYSTLKIGEKYCQNIFGMEYIVDVAMHDSSEIVVLAKEVSHDAIKPWKLSSITFENNKFVHHSKGCFFTEDGGQKYYTMARGLKWNGPDSIDDYY